MGSRPTHNLDLARRLAHTVATDGSARARLDAERQLWDLATCEDYPSWLADDEVLGYLVQALRPNWANDSLVASADEFGVATVCATAEQLVRRASAKVDELLFELLVGPPQPVIAAPSMGPALGAKLAAMRLIGPGFGPADTPLLLRLLADGREPDELRDAVATELLRIDGEGLAPDIARALITYDSRLHDEFSRPGRRAVRVAMVPTLIAGLHGRMPGGSARAASLLAYMGLVAVEPLTALLLSDAPAAVRRLAGQTLRRISPVDYAALAERLNAVERGLSHAEAPTEDADRGLSRSSEG